ncbi:hypothetical protein CCUG63695_04748 [Mycobacteroides franklinii]|nr:hypothetical protein CCUG63695_04748 [Mycobacteroides franklinii]
MRQPDTVMNVKPAHLRLYDLEITLGRRRAIEEQPSG